MKRIYHSWDKWECFKAGFYDDKYGDKTNKEARAMFGAFFGDLNLFESALKLVISKWKYSCEHFLTNPNINKIAWLGQAAACIRFGLPSKYRSGFYLLSKEKQKAANRLAERYYYIWLKKHKNILKNGKNKDIQLEFPMRSQEF